MANVTVKPTTPDKAGVKTSEFWVVLSALAGSAVAYFQHPGAGGSLHDLVVGAGPLLTGAYALGRTYIKSLLAKNPPATVQTITLSGGGSGGTSSGTYVVGQPVTPPPVAPAATTP